MEPRALSNTLLALHAQQEKVRQARSFPLGPIIEEVLREHNVPYRTVQFWGGFDTRVCMRYELFIPVEQVPRGGMLGRIGAKKIVPAVGLDQLCEGIVQRSTEREWKTEPAHQTGKVATFYPRAPVEETNDYAYIDVAKLVVAGHVPAPARELGGPEYARRTFFGR